MSFICMPVVEGLRSVLKLLKKLGESHLQVVSRIRLYFYVTFQQESVNFLKRGQ
jgi:hypothetical protein